MRHASTGSAICNLKSAIILLLLIPATASADVPDKVKPITVPFELLKTQHMVVSIKVNGKGPYRVIFDTGAPVNLLNNKVAKEADIIPKKHPRPWFTPFGSMGQFKVKSLEVGKVEAKDMNAIIMDHPTVELISKYMGPIEGIIGFSFFGKYRTTIDYQTKVMTFVPTKYRPPDMMDNMMKMLMAPAASKKVVAPAGQWGFRVHKPADDKDPGVNVKDVMESGPAASAGLRAGDRLLTLAGRWTDTVGDCYLAASQIAPGTEALLRVIRDGKEMSLKVRVGSGI